MKSGIPQVETHGAERIGKRVGFGDEDSGSVAAVAADEHGGGAVAEQDRRDQVGLRNVLALEGERGEFNGDNQDVSAGIGLQEIGRATQRHRARGAAKFGEGHASDVGAEAH